MPSLGDLHSPSLILRLSSPRFYLAVMQEKNLGEEGLGTIFCVR